MGDIRKLTIFNQRLPTKWVIFYGQSSDWPNAKSGLSHESHWDTFLSGLYQ